MHLPAELTLRRPSTAMKHTSNLHKVGRGCWGTAHTDIICLQARWGNAEMPTSFMRCIVLSQGAAIGGLRAA